MIATHYLNGAWYPIGGAGVIAKATGAVIRAAGGELLPNHEVTRILLDGDRAVGVEVNIRKGKEGAHAEMRAPVVVSDAGAWNTFTRMLPESGRPFGDQTESLPEGCQVVELFLGLRRDPRELGFHGENHWIFESYDHDLLDGSANMAYLSFPSLKETLTPNTTLRRSLRRSLVVPSKRIAMNPGADAAPTTNPPGIA